MARFDTGADRRHAVVVGGGFAGAAAATALAEAGVAVTLVEERGTLGGRTSSYRDGVTRQDVDNGQHLFLGAYRDTRAFLRRLKVENRLRWLPGASTEFYARSGKKSVLNPGRLPGALGFLRGVLGFGALTWRDKASLLYGLTRLRWDRSDNHGGRTVAAWLKGLRQTPGALRAFWDPLCYATLNERPDRAAADALVSVLREGFFKSVEDRALGYSTVPLGRLWATELPAYLKNQGGDVAAKIRATGFVVEDGRVRALEIEGGTPVPADVFVSAVPLRAARALMGPRVPALSDLPSDASPIAAVNFWFSRPPFAAPWVGFLDLDIQWGFNREVLWGRGAEGQVSLVLSAGRDHVARSSDQLIALALADLRRAFPAFKEEPTHATVTWEKEATPAPTPGFWRGRPGVTTPLANLFLAGDWIDAGLPPTIEAACRSGHRAAAFALRWLDGQKEDECLKPYCSTATA